ncbi:hypothetical protein [Massilia niastensis]|nr:hypothetical protein [Massilia niastensis]
MRDTSGDHRPPPPDGDEGVPKFGRLLLILALALLMIVAITLGSEAWFS